MASKRRKSRKAEGAAPDKQKSADRRFAIAIFGSAIALWASFPPVGLSLLAWIAPAGWIYVAKTEAKITRRGWWALWASGALFWLATLQGIRLAYWPLHFGWLALSLFLAIYTPLFVVIARRLTGQFAGGKLPMYLAAPVSWVACELARAWILTGFAACGLAHSQVAFPVVIQIADQLGTYGVSFVMILTCAAVVELCLAARAGKLRQAFVPAAAASVCITGMLAYGVWKLSEADQMLLAQSDDPPLLDALLVQENTPTVFDSGRSGKDLQEAYFRYLDTTRQAVRKHGIPDLVVWPESTFGGGLPYVLPDRPSPIPALPARSSEERQADLQILDSNFKAGVFYTLRAARGEEMQGPIVESPKTPHLLVGTTVVRITPDEDQKYNSALFINPRGEVAGQYDKMHAVMFGEYFPLGVLLKPLRDMYPITIFTGSEPQAFEVGETRVAPNICFESMVPRLISRQVRELAARGASPDVIANLSNDSWFRGSSMLDHHLACTILTAVENRRPVIVAANTGISAQIDGSGRVLQRSKRKTATAILAQPRADSRPGLVQAVGYPLAWLCGLVSFIACLPFGSRFSQADAM
ncbi:MAG TPA: apolipoprotein N-acyltransferase [Planctomycetaceae bacterium]|nr:apolipoprotein N-acyltransferase [Planctomycetaceae bacterium]